MAALLQRADRHDALPDGHRLHFAASDDVRHQIVRVIGAERMCCRFLRSLPLSLLLRLGYGYRVKSEIAWVEHVASGENDGALDRVP